LFWSKVLDVRVDFDVSQREEGMKAAGPKKVLKLIDTLAEISISGVSMVEGVPGAAGVTAEISFEQIKHWPVNQRPGRSRWRCLQGQKCHPTLSSISNQLG